MLIETWFAPFIPNKSISNQKTQSITTLYYALITLILHTYIYRLASNYAFQQLAPVYSAKLQIPAAWLAATAGHDPLRKLCD